jgi:hypothetical protein
LSIVIDANVLIVLGLIVAARQRSSSACDSDVVRAKNGTRRCS